LEVILKTSKARKIIKNKKYGLSSAKKQNIADIQNFDNILLQNLHNGIQVMIIMYLNVKYFIIKHGKCKKNCLQVRKGFVVSPFFLNKVIGILENKRKKRD
jgi:hypothetical protein